MVFSRVLVDDIVEAICDEDFGLSDGNGSNFEGGDDIHALLRATVLWHEDVIGDCMDRGDTSEARSEGQYDYAIEMPEASPEMEGEHEESCCVISLGDTHTADPCIRMTGGGRQDSVLDGGKETQSIHKQFSIIGIN